MIISKINVSLNTNILQYQYTCTIFPLNVVYVFFYRGMPSSFDIFQGYVSII